jgi:hypothetical protein
MGCAAGLPARQALIIQLSDRREALIGDGIS